MSRISKIIETNRKQAYRARLYSNPKKHEAFLKRCRRTYARQKIDGLIKSIEDFDEKDKVVIRRKWKLQKRKYRASLKKSKGKKIKTNYLVCKKKYPVLEIRKSPYTPVKGWFFC